MDNEVAVPVEAAATRIFFAKNSPEWKEVLALVLEKAYSDQSFFNRIIKNFAENPTWLTSEFSRNAMKSFRAGIAVYGKLSEKTPEGVNKAGKPKLSQLELAMSILREHPSVLVEEYAADVGIDLDGENVPF